MTSLLKHKIYWLRKIFQSTKNPFKVLIFRFGFLKNCDCNFKQFGVIKLSEKDIKTGFFTVLLVSGSKDISNNGKKIADEIISQKDKNIINLKSAAVKLLNMRNLGQFLMLFEIFVQEDYHLKKTTNNEVVIDIGGNMGIAAIYFANKGYDVYSFEPIKDVINIARKNLELNENLKNKVHFIEKAVTDKKGIIKIAYEGLDYSESSSTYLNSGKFLEVETTTIKDIFNKYQIEPKILKMDCEGSEYDIIKNTDLSMFNEIIVEYHAFLTGLNPKILINKLKNQGFKVKKIEIDSPDFSQNSELGIGFIKATK